MKALPITIIFTLIFALGLVQNVHAQASASVSYTIVVTEDMLATRGHDKGMGFENDALESSEQVPQSSVSVRIQEMGGYNARTSSFDAEMSPGNAPAIAGMIDEGFKSVYAEESKAGMKTERSEKEEGEYLVVMEFN